MTHSIAGVGAVEHAIVLLLRDVFSVWQLHQARVAQIADVAPPLALHKVLHEGQIVVLGRAVLLALDLDDVVKFFWLVFQPIIRKTFFVVSVDSICFPLGHITAPLGDTCFSKRISLATNFIPNITWKLMYAFKSTARLRLNRHMWLALGVAQGEDAAAARHHVVAIAADAVAHRVAFVAEGVF